MKTLVTLLALAMLTVACQQQKPAEPAPKADAPKTEAPKAAAKTELATDAEKNSYAIGMDIGKRIAQLPFELNADLVAMGVKDSFSGKTLLTDDQVRDTLTAMQNKMMEEQQAKQKAQAEKNLAEGQKFLEANKAKEGVKTTDSGLQYKILSAGNGPKPKAEDVVTVHYRGTLTDGTEFDSSARRGQPVTFPLTGVIPGWTEALQLMPVGSKWELYVPAHLAYGERQVGQQITPNSTLIFEVELISIEPKEEAKKEEPKKEAPKPAEKAKDAAKKAKSAAKPIPAPRMAPRQ